MEKKGKLLLFLTIILFSIFSVNAVAPNVTFVSQSPNDIDSQNLIAGLLNITYNITGADLNTSTIRLYHKTNKSDASCVYFLNGSEACGSGYQETTPTSNVSSLYLFQISHVTIYGGTYNYNQFIMREIIKSQYDLDGDTEYTKMQFFNVSNNKSYNYFFINADNQTALSGTLRMYYCNSSFTSGNPLTSSSCTNFYNMLSTEPFDATPAQSKYHVIPFLINTTTGMINNVYVTPTSYLLLRGRIGADAWNVAYITNVSRTNAMQTTAGGPGYTWTNFAGTFDAHFHQFTGEEVLYYTVCANDTTGNSNCGVGITNLFNDTLGLGGMPPYAPIMISPVATNYSGNITINYTAAISPPPNSYSVYYNISLRYAHDLGNESDDTLFQIIKGNNSGNLSYVFDTVTEGIPDGYYNVHVLACDELDQCKLGESENFLLDNTDPIVAMSCSSSEVSRGGEISCNCNANDNLAGVSYKSFETSPSTSKYGTFSATCTVNDTAGNFATDSFVYTVLGSSSGGGTASSNQKIISFPEISPLKPAQIKNFNKNIGIENINISVSETSKNVQITINKYTPIIKKEGKVYHYFFVSAKNLDNMKKAEWTLKVEKSWIKSNLIEKEEISLFRFNDLSKTWEELSTSYKNESQIYYYYSAESDSFSNFAIGEKTKTETEETDTTGEEESNPIISFGENIFWNYSPEQFIAIIIFSIALTLIIIKLIRNKRPTVKKIEKSAKKDYVSSYTKKSVYKKIAMAKELKRRSNELMKEAMKRKEHDAMKKIREARELKKKYDNLMREAHYICKKCKVDYTKNKKKK